MTSARTIHRAPTTYAMKQAGVVLADLTATLEFLFDDGVQNEEDFALARLVAHRPPRMAAFRRGMRPQARPARTRGLCPISPDQSP
ncbi:MAG: hypothetical protein JW940_11110 [Polyangiaceae bacterium]|nr:hypothetical protein [Polyangiaceae bacterium]